MFRRYKKPIRYQKEGITIRHASLDEEYEIGNWTSSYDWIKIGYEYDKYQSKYSDMNYVMVYRHEIIGYFLSYTEINVGANPNIPLYSKELIVYDFVVDIRAYSKFSKKLINFMIKYARHYGYSAITFYKIDKYNEFNKFINRHYDIKEIDNKLYLFIDNPKIRICEKHLTIYENDKISIEDLYFLFDFNFDILKTKCKLKLNDYEQIVIDRTTGIITFPSNVEVTNEVILNKCTKTLIYLIKGLYYANKIMKVSIYFDKNNPNYYEADMDGLLCVSKKLNDIRDDKNYIDSLINRGYDRVVPNHLEYNINERGYSESFCVYKLIK